MTSEHQSITGQTPGTTPRLRVDVLTTFTEMFASGRGDAGTGTDPGVVATGALNVSIPARARAAGLVEWHAHDLRAFTHSKHRKTDDRPFGGGPGMVMMCQPVYDAVRAVEALDPRPARRVLMSPQGKRLTQELVEELARESRVLIIAGHYEGLDERVLEELSPLEVSLGDYVLSGGELAAMVLMDAIIRLLPGALGDEESAVQDSFSAETLPGLKKRRSGGNRALGTNWAHGADGAQGANEGGPTVSAATGRADEPLVARLLDCPHYTKPREWMGREVPDVLLSGDHEAIARWRLEQRVRRTIERRPDLLTPEAWERLRAMGLA
jgi:tRNA (guanine37-N1)-methyltransferase